ncbi:MAG TPA: ATP-binding cassette domain-containing protein, partial [Agromyces sp.]|nr:ATP-binding cassette domain-containing protein [Agromyces sp.]
MTPRFTVLAALGLALAVIAEGSALGLLALSGWFITSCAIAGVALGSTFSYLTPSGGVRAFALTRIAANYGARIVLHRVALARLTDIRVGLFTSAVGSSRHALRAMRDGEALDRTMRDAELESESVIRWQAPACTLIVCGAGVAVVLLAISPATALALVASGLAMAMIAIIRDGRSREPDAARERARLRGELVAAIEAWPEMRSLGATGALRHRTDSLLDRQERMRAGTSSSRSSTRAVLGVLAALSLGAIVAVATLDGTRLPDLVLIALLAATILENAAGLGTILAARRDARSARDRLAAVADGRLAPRDVADEARPLADLSVEAGETLVVFGPTGIGKTTLLEAFADRPRAASKVVFVPHDDHLFTGTVASNLRLADPHFADVEIALLLAEFELAPAGITGSTRTGVGGRALSGGEQRRIHLARAVLAKPDVLIVDEPGTALDEGTASIVLGAIRRRLPGAAIVYATHEPLAGDHLGPVRTLDLGA